MPRPGDLFHLFDQSNDDIGREPIDLGIVMLLREDLHYGKPSGWWTVLLASTGKISDSWPIDWMTIVSVRKPTG
jgi:hypothetical protein